MSWEATCWVMERSTHKGGDLFCLLLIANDMNAEGRGSFSPRHKLARQMRVDRRTVMRCLRRLEKSGELVCDSRGSGHDTTWWRIPGVVLDGFAAGMRGGKLPPQGRRIALPGEAKRPPSGGVMPPIPSLPILPTVEKVNMSPPPPPKSRGEEQEARNNHQVKTPLELKKWLAKSAVKMDGPSAERLWLACRARAPECTSLQVEWACQHKLERSAGARNLAGLIIATVPDLLVEELAAAGVARPAENTS